MIAKIHTVEDGQIKRLSVSQIEKFEPGRSPWSCPRRWWFRYVARLPEPQTGAQAEGEAVHAQIEHYLKTGQDALGPVAREGFEYIPAPGPDLLVEHELAPGELTALGIPFAGKIDCYNPRGEIPEILDWKTSSSITRYAKTPEQLRKSVQMLGYAKWRLNLADFAKIRLTHVYFQTGPKRDSERITCIVDRETVKYEWQQVEVVVGRMVDVAKQSDAQRVPKNEKACVVGRSVCPYFNQCNASPRSISVPLLDLLATETVSALPPDAPKSDPLLAADPVPGFTALTPSVIPAPSESAASSEPEPPKKRGPGRPAKFVTSVTIRHQSKLNLGNYQSAGVEVEMTASVDGEIEATTQKLSALVRGQLLKELAIYAERK